MDIDIRRSVAADAAQACTVLRRRSIVKCCTLDQDGDPTMLERWLHNKTPENLLQWIEDRDGIFLVAETASTLIGVALLKADGTVALCYLLPGRAFLGAVKHCC